MNKDKPLKRAVRKGIGRESDTPRGKERDEEDREYQPVIVKRTDEARRHPDDILQFAIEEGSEQLQRAPFSLFLSSVGAGLTIGFSAMAVGIVTTLGLGVDSTIFHRLAPALVYPLGFVVCLMSGTELFTEHTATAVYPVLDRRAGYVSLLRLWALVGAGNILGTIASAGLLWAAEPVVRSAEGYVRIGSELAAVPDVSLFVSAVLAGWLMALGAWLLLATTPTISQMASIYIVTFLIGLAGFHHSIAGSAEIFTAYFVGSELGIGQVIRFLFFTMVGNLIGGGLFVAGLNYAHIRRSRVAEE